MIEFKLSEEQEEKIRKWRERIPPLADKYKTADGGSTSYCFTPTGLGLIVTIKRVDGEELDLTEWEYF